MLCPKCGEDKSTMLRKVPFDDGADLRIRRCKSCGHVYHTTERLSGSIDATALSKSAKSSAPPAPTRAA